MYEILQGNIIDLAEEGKLDILVQGCNCQNTMGSGLAGELKRRYPRVYDADSAAAEIWEEPVARLGNFSSAYINMNGHPVIVINAYTQVDYLPRGIDHFEYEAFHIILKKLEVLAKPRIRFGFPRIGQGLAGGDPDRINQMLYDFGFKISIKGSKLFVVDFPS